MDADGVWDIPPWYCTEIERVLNDKLNPRRVDRSLGAEQRVPKDEEVQEIRSMVSLASAPSILHSHAQVVCPVTEMDAARMPARLGWLQDRSDTPKWRSPGSRSPEATRSSPRPARSAGTRSTTAPSTASGQSRGSIQHFDRSCLD